MPNLEQIIKLNPCLAGVDEAGRGPLAGPVVAAAVILDVDKPILGLKDSKLLSEKKREQLFAEIREKSLAYGIASASLEEIENLNILQATMLAMQRAIDNLSIKPSIVLIDGNQVPKTHHQTMAVVKGDRLVQAISAASILAKVTRDREMLAFDKEFPDYGFAKHKGYGTALHLEKIAELGPCAIHRKTFQPFRSMQFNIERL